MSDVPRYPFAGETPRRTLATGALLSALSILVIPGIFVAGYYGRVLARSAAGEDRPPTFDGWRALFVQGLKTSFVVAAYFAIAVLVVVALVVVSLLLGELGTGAGALVGLLAIVVGVLVFLAVLFGPAWFFLPAILTHVARNDDMWAAFDVSTLCRVTLRREYAVPWLVGTAVVLLGSVAYSLLGGFEAIASVGSGGWITAATVVLGLAGHGVGVAVNFYCQVVAAHVFGRGYRAALEAAGGATVDDDRVAEPDDRGWGAEARVWRDRRRRERERAG